jgi:serine/threonine-protein kinase
VIPEPTSQSIWDNPWAVVLIGGLLALIAGLGSWMLVSSLNRQGDPQASVTPTATFSDTPSPLATETPTPTPTESTSFSQRLNLPAGRAVSRTGSLKANTTINYIVPGQQDQRLTAYLAGEGALMTVLGPDQNPVGNRSRRVQQWEGALPFTGDYTIQLSPVQGLTDSDYNLTVSLANPTAPTTPPTTTLPTTQPTTPPTTQPTTSPTTAPTTSPTTSPTQTFDPERLSFAAGQQTGQFAPKGRTSPQRIKRYIVNIQNGQTLAATVQQGDVSLDISSPNGQILQNASGVRFWQAPGPLTAGEYVIDVRTSQETDFTLGIEVANSQ